MIDPAAFAKSMPLHARAAWDRSVTQQAFTADQAKMIVRNLAKALHANQRLPVTVTCTDEPDGTLTLRIAPS